MSKVAEFRKEHDLIVGIANAQVAAIRYDVDTALETLATKTFGPAEECADDGMGPPGTPVRVECWHCGGKYLSSKMKWEYRPHFQAAVVEGLGNGIVGLRPLWWCKDPDCDGAGFGHDIHPVTARKPRKGGDA